MYVISQQTEGKFKFDFKVIGENPRDILPGKDYWARSYLSTWHSIALRTNAKCSMNGNSLTINNQNGSVTKYKIEGDFTQEQIDVINSGLEAGLELNFLTISVNSLGVEGLRAVLQTRKENVAA